MPHLAALVLVLADDGPSCGVGVGVEPAAGRTPSRTAWGARTQAASRADGCATGGQDRHSLYLPGTVGATDTMRLALTSPPEAAKPAAAAAPLQPELPASRKTAVQFGFRPPQLPLSPVLCLRFPALAP